MKGMVKQEHIDAALQSPDTGFNISCHCIMFHAVKEVWPEVTGMGYATAVRREDGMLVKAYDILPKSAVEDITNLPREDWKHVKPGLEFQLVEHPL